MDSVLAPAPGAPLAVSSRAVLGRLINLAGRQRMLSHRAVMFLALGRGAVQEVERIRLLNSARQAFANFAAAHRTILNGDAEAGLPRLTSSRVRSLLETPLPDRPDRLSGAALVERFLAEGRRALGRQENARHAADGALEDLSAMAASDLLDLFTRMTAAFEADLTDAAAAEAAQAIEVRRIVAQTLENIEDLGARVNLIAINALIEAARAGDAGKAFAFVGHEIKSLGQQTREEAERMKAAIARLIEGARP
jgi:hypothetical protein